METSLASKALDNSTLIRLAARTSAVSLAHTRTLPVPEPLTSLFPDAGLRLGSVLHCPVPSVTLSVIAHVTSQGYWCAVVNEPQLSFAAISSLGGDLEKCVFVTVPDESWVPALASLLDGCSFVTGKAPKGVRSHHVRQLTSRVQERESILWLSSLKNWDLQPSISVVATGQEWRGLYDGHGLLNSRLLHLESSGKGAASRPRSASVWLPNRDGDLAAVTGSDPVTRPEKELAELSAVS